MTQLWQIIKKEHLDIDNKLSKKQWDNFVSQWENDFAEESSHLAQDLFTHYKSENNIND